MDAGSIAGVRIEPGNAVMYCPPAPIAENAPWQGPVQTFPAYIGASPAHHSIPYPHRPVQPSALNALRSANLVVGYTLQSSKLGSPHSAFPHMPWAIAISPSRARSRAERYLAYSKCVELSM